VQLRTFSFHPCLYPAMLNAASPDAKPGSFVQVYDKEGRPFGAGLYNPTARVPLRMLCHGPGPFTEEHLTGLLERAINLRLAWFRQSKDTDTYRVVSSDGDGLSGLTVDRYADVLSVEVHSLGMHQRLERWLPLLHARLGTKRAVVHVEDRAARLEGIQRGSSAAPAPKTVHVREHGIRFEVDFTKGHKTGFFCDQRENRLQLTRLMSPGRVLDLCCYTGGFAVTAAVLGGASDVTGVDLDENAVAQARRNGNLNQQNRINWVHADAFSWARQMQQNGERWQTVVVDPPRLIGGGEEDDREGWRKYEDLNGLAFTLVEPGGLLVTCSCSGPVTLEDFEQLLIRTAHRQSRRLQFLDRTGAGPDHPVMSHCLESRYLKVLWARVW
jgi:23S rRNA (cytosine1962-C5)-methyltransferase